MTTLPEAKLFIDGELRGASDGGTFDVISPWTGQPVGKAADGTADDVNAAIAAARRAFDETDWGSSANAQNRLALVTKLRDLFKKNHDRLGELAVHEAGAGPGEINLAQVGMAMDGWDDYINKFAEIEWEKDHGERFSAMANLFQQANCRARTGWGRCCNHSMERAALCQHRQGCRGTSGRLYGDPQACARYARHGGDLRRTGTGGRHPAGRHQCGVRSRSRRGGRNAGAGSARRLDLVHRLYSGRQAHHGAGRQDNEARVPRTGRQVGQNRAR